MRRETRRRAVGFLFVATIGIAAITINATITVRAQVIQSGRLCLANGAVVEGPTAGLSVQPCPEPAVVTAANVPDALMEPVSAQPLAGRSNSTVYWGYEANFDAPSRVIAYHAVVGNPAFADCVPLGPHIPAVSNGRGLAFDPRNAGNQPFPEPHLLLGPTGTLFTQDISICGYRAKFGGGGNDSCPY